MSILPSSSSLKSTLLHLSAAVWWKPMKGATVSEVPCCLEEAKEHSLHKGLLCLPMSWITEVSPNHISTSYPSHGQKLITYSKGTREVVSSATWSLTYSFPSVQVQTVLIRSWSFPYDFVLWLRKGDKKNKTQQDKTKPSCWNLSWLDGKQSW